ncbi:MAG: PEP-CTERM sorting domain-containing protein [Phycisphaerae bacterium]
MKLLKEAEMRAIKLVGLVTLLCASTVFAQTTGTAIWNSRAIVFDGDGNPIDMSQPINPALYPTGVYLQWTISCVVTGNNQGLAGAMVGWGIQDSSGNWAPFEQDPANLQLAPVYKSPGVGVNGTVADNATAGGLGAGPGAGKGWPVAGIFYVDQMGMGYLDWQGRRYKTTIPKGWIGNQQWGMGLDSRKAAILRDGVDGTYDLTEGIVEITAVPPGTYHSAFDPLDKNITSKVLNVGQDLNQDLPAVDFIDVPIVRGDTFSFTIVPEPATLLLLAGAGLLARRRRA